MTPLEIEFIEKTIGSEQKQFYYYRDKYALQLIQYHVKDNIKISELKNSRYQGLLNKSVVQDAVKKCGSGQLSPNQLADQLIHGATNFNYTISKWGEHIPHRNDSWNQTSRPGFNLVLQLNFDEWHNFKYHDLIRNRFDHEPFVFDEHPVAEKRNHTMSWARLDINLDSGEVLIEEIQNDWLREVRDFEKLLMVRKLSPSRRRKAGWFFTRCSIRKFQAYADFMNQYHRIWDEAILSLAIHFARVELALDKVYYHDFDSGNLLKGLTYSKPPRSLYTRLPKRFCFEQTKEAPEFIKKENYLRKKLRNNDLKWWVLNI